MRTTIFHSSAIAVALAATSVGAHGQSAAPDTTTSVVVPATPGEQNAAPYLDRDGGPRKPGVIVGSAEVSGIIEASNRERFELGENVYLTLPAGVSASMGDQLYTFALDTTIARGQIVIPTGVIQVVRPGVGPEATTARIVQEFGNIRLHQGVLPLPPAGTSGPLASVDNGVVSRILWISDDAVLPGVQYYVVLGATERDGVHVGDEFTIYRAATRLPESSVVLPAADIAVVQVVHVNAFGTTALVVRQMQPAIHVGAAARLTAKSQ